MKKLFFVLHAFTCISLAACMHNDHATSLTYSEDDRYYSMKAYFSKDKTQKVDDYMDDRIGSRSHMSFTNSRIDGTITLDDHTKFYIKKSPGILEIKLDKNDNADESYLQIKSMCQGIKKILAR